MGLRSRVLVVALAVAMAAGVAAPTGAGAHERSAPRRRAAPDEIGPYAVGRSTFTVSDPAREGRTLTVDAVYPVDADEAVGEASLYDLILATITSPNAVADAPVSSAGPFPLVVFSHGSGGTRYQSYFLTEALASHGFVVVSPDHAGNTANDLLLGSPAPFTAVDRPKDVSFLIDRMTERTADPSDPLAGAIDLRRIGVVGHSFGGFTALAVASGFAEYEPDERVDAIVPISPASNALTDEELASIELPTMLIGGTADTTTPIDPATTRPWELLGSNRRYRADVIGAGHSSFTNICDFYFTLAGVPGLPANILDFLADSAADGCAAELVPVGEAQRLTRFYTVSFLRRFLARDLRAGLALRPRRVTGIDDPDTLFGRVPGRAGLVSCTTVAPRPRCERAVA